MSAICLATLERCIAHGTDRVLLQVQAMSHTSSLSPLYIIYRASVRASIRAGEFRFLLSREGCISILPVCSSVAVNLLINHDQSLRYCMCSAFSPNLRGEGFPRQRGNRQEHQGDQGGSPVHPQHRCF